MAHLQQAMRDARVQIDARGCMPLDEARLRVQATDVYRKGQGESIDGFFVLESDMVWAALLSLEDGEEFLREARRIRFEFHVRGMENTAAVERYGDSVLAWVAANVEGGVLRNVPWCLLPCLLAMETADALALALSIRAVSNDERGGPGAFAAGGDGDVDTAGELRQDADDSSVARKWVVHSGRGANQGARRALLEQRAASDARAQALLDALRPSLPPVVQALLAGADRANVPAGPAVAIAELDESTRSYDFPIWDNCNFTTGAMRITGVVSPEGDCLALETITHWPSASQGFVRETIAFGPGAGVRTLQQQLVPNEQLVEWVSDSTCLHRVTGVTITTDANDGQWRELIVSPPGGTNTSVELTVGGQAVNVLSTLPDIPDLDDEKRACARLLDPADVALFQLAEPPTRHLLFHTADALVSAIHAPAGAQVLFAFDEWQHPRAGERASASIDLVTMVAALGARARIERLPGVPNSRFHHWLEHLAEHRGYPAAWGNGCSLADGPVPHGAGNGGDA